MILRIQDKSRIRFIHKSVLVGLKGQERYRVIFMLENINTKIKVPHPLTEYLSEYDKLEHSSVVQKANYIVLFLNYVCFNEVRKYRIKTLCDLKFQHGVDFLNDYSSGIITKNIPNRDTVKSAERILITFYEFLLNKRLLNDEHNTALETGEYYQEYRGLVKYKKSPFRGIRYPRSKRTNKLSSIPVQLIIPFIELSINETPEIALGIYFQIFGGLRMSEVINLSTGSIELIGAYGEYGINLNVKERYFRDDISNNNGKWGVKKPRNQYIMPIQDILPKLYKNHINNYVNRKDTEALFINKNNDAMSGDSYKARFDRLKKVFIEKLLQSDYADLKTYGLVLLSKKWSTHIGRGTFSKIVADYTKNPTELAVLRGDSSYTSVFPYIQGSFGVQEAINNVMHEFYKNLN